MKKIFLILLMLLPMLLLSQGFGVNDNFGIQNISKIKHQPIDFSFSDTSRIKYLRNDDSVYNKKYSIWNPVLGVVAVNGLTWVYDRYVLNVDYSHTGIKVWKKNLTIGWAWDNDRFGVNFIAHPLSGAMCFNTARSTGYNYLQSFYFAVGGSVMWKYFGENSTPSYNDLINTSVNGAMLGEILYRISSNVLDDTKRGSERVFREIFAGIINPVRGVNRLIQGKSFRVTPKEVYQKEPLEVSFAGGIQKINNGTKFGTGEISGLASLDIVYGNPFEQRNRKPFDYFENNIVFNNGDGAIKRWLDNISVYGILFGKNVQAGNLNMLIGVFQHYDYYNNNIFELGNIAFSGGVISKLPIGAKSFLYTNLHLGIVPFGGYSTKFGPDTSKYRDYNFGGGIGGRLECALDICSFVNIKLLAYYYWMSTYSGTPGSNLIGIVKPNILFRIYKNLNLGFEYFLYTNDRHDDKYSDLVIKSSRQRVVVLYKIKN